MNIINSNPEIIQRSIDAIKNMETEELAKMLEEQSVNTGFNISPSMSKMSAEIMKNMDMSELKKIMSLVENNNINNINYMGNDNNTPDNILDDTSDNTSDNINEQLIYQNNDADLQYLLTPDQVYMMIRLSLYIEKTKAFCKNNVLFKTFIFLIITYYINNLLNFFDIF